MKPSLRIEIDPDLLDRLYELGKRDRKELGDLIQEVRKGFGHPHLHTGTGIRDLAPGVYECRRNLHQRLVFTAHKGYLYFHFLGNHEEVRRFLKSL
ncbi:MAG TPA: hypothetical protein VIM58_11750 [Candidatus Methylacidiphilales bacterium]